MSVAVFKRISKKFFKIVRTPEIPIYGVYLDLKHYMYDFLLFFTIIFRLRIYFNFF